MTRTATLSLPWPDSRLSPNARGHWSKKEKPRKAAIKLAGQECIAWRVGRGWAGPLRVTVDFYPPDRRKRDDDNVIGAFKPYRDGIAAFIGVDDAEWHVTYALHRGEPKPGGQVVVRIEEVD